MVFQAQVIGLGCFCQRIDNCQGLCAFIGRKGWLFSDTPEGAEATAIVYSLMETTKTNGFRLEDYIQYLLSVLPERLSADPYTDIEDL